MGNVLAAAPKVSTLEPPPPPPSSPNLEEKKDEKLINDSGLLNPNLLGYLVKNPGTMDDLHKKCKGFYWYILQSRLTNSYLILNADIFPSPFEGSKVIINKGLSNHFQICHTINMSSSTPSGYRFGATYVGDSIVGPGEAYPVFLGDIDPSGNVNANVFFQLHPKIRTKMVAQVINQSLQVLFT